MKATHYYMAGEKEVPTAKIQITMYVEMSEIIDAILINFTDYDINPDSETYRLVVLTKTPTKKEVIAAIRDLLKYRGQEFQFDHYADDLSDGLYTQAQEIAYKYFPDFIPDDK